MGLILSVHLNALQAIDNKEKKEQPIGREVISEFKVPKFLHIAYVNKSPVIIQADVMANGHFYPDLKCMVLRYQEDDMYLKLKDDRKIKCELY